MRSSSRSHVRSVLLSELWGTAHGRNRGTFSCRFPSRCACSSPPIGRCSRRFCRLSTAAPLPVMPATAQRCVNAQGFSLHAETRLAIKQRHKLEQLCRYITRPAIANERLSVNPTGQVVLTLKTPYHDGTTQLVMEPLEFMQRLAPPLFPVRVYISSGSMACLHPTPSCVPPLSQAPPPRQRGHARSGRDTSALSLGAYQLGSVAQAYSISTWSIAPTAAAP